MVGCSIPVVLLGASDPSIVEGSEVEVEGALTERRWEARGGTRKNHFEILARMARVL